jgi:2-polyprenyl-3-methyl-5-hydroxy-6-metoxy-1,4-benzoquinol methylase
VATDFDAAAETWDDDPTRRARTEALAEAVRAAVPLDASTRVLEYGAGTGLLSHRLAPYVGAITVADASAGMVEVAGSRIEQSGLAHLTARRLDLTVDPVPDERYDLVVSIMAMHHVSDVPRVLAAFHELLEPGGAVAIADLDHDPDNHFHAHDFDGHRGFDRVTLGGWLAGAGFTDVTLSTPHVVTKEVAGTSREFPLFLAVGHR